MPVPKIQSAPESVRSLQRGIDLLADLLGPTLGPRPAGVMDLAHKGQAPEALDDAPTIARRIVEVPDRQADVGVMFLRQLVWQTERRLGDGGATVAVLCQAMFKEAVRLAEAGASRSMLARGLDWAGRRGGEFVMEQSRPVPDETALAQVARTATGDREISALIGEAVFLMGSDAIIQVEEYEGRSLDLRFHAPAELKASLSGSDLTRSQEDSHLRLTDCLVAAVDGELSEDDDMLALFKAALYAGKKNLLILARDFSDTVQAWFTLNRQNPDGPVAAVGARYDPTASAADCPYDDLTHLTGATVLGLPHTKPVSSVGHEDFGVAAQVEIVGEATRISPISELRPRAAKHARDLRHRLEQLDEDDASRAWLRRRIAAMDLGYGEFRVGADTELELQWRKRIIERGLVSTALALEYGIVPGGGSSLLKGGQALSDRMPRHPEIRLGVECAARALATPALQLLRNSGHSSSTIAVRKIQDEPGPLVFDVISGQAVDGFSEGIVDPARVVAETFQMAASGAATAITIDALVFRRNPPRMARP